MGSDPLSIHNKCMVLSCAFGWFFQVFLDHFLYTKDQALPTFIKFKTLVEKQFNLPIRCLQSDNGGEFKACASFLSKHGIENHCSCSKTPKQNGKAKRKIWHIIDIGITLLAIASLPLNFDSIHFKLKFFLSISCLLKFSIFSHFSKFFLRNH